MSKLFRFKAYWYNDQSNPDKGADDGVVAAESYTTAAQHIEDYYGEEIIGFYLEEIDNPLFVEEIKDWTDKQLTFIEISCIIFIQTRK